MPDDLGIRSAPAGSHDFRLVDLDELGRFALGLNGVGYLLDLLDGEAGTEDEVLDYATCVL